MEFDARRQRSHHAGGKARMLNILQEVETVAPYFDEKGQVLMEQEVPFLPVRTAR